MEEDVEYFELIVRILPQGYLPIWVMVLLCLNFVETINDHDERSNDAKSIIGFGSLQERSELG